MTPEKEIALGYRAEEILENPAYIAAFASMKQEIEDQWKNSPARDVEGRERLWLMQSLLGKLQITLAAVMQGGNVAKMNLKHEQSLLERVGLGR